MPGAIPGALALAAACVALAWLLAEQGPERSAALRRVAASSHGLARLLIGALLSGAMAGALAMLLSGGAYRIPAASAGFIVASLACAALLRRRHPAELRTALPWLCAMLAPLFVALACIARSAQHWLIGGFVLAFLLGLGLPAFGALARRFDDSDVPAFMRPLPARALAAGILALAMAGSLSW